MTYSGPPTIAGLRVVIVEDHSLVAQSLLIAFRAHDAVARAAELTSAADVIAACRAFDPQVILLDLDLGEAVGDGVDLVAPLSDVCRVAILTGSQDEVRLGRCLEAGAIGLIAKTASLDALIAEVGRVGAGENIISTARREELLARSRRHRDERRRALLAFESLTDRECDVLAALVQGRQVEEMTREFFVTETTVRTHVRAILHKLNVRSQLAAVAYAHDAGWRSPPTAASQARAGRGAA